MFVCYIIIICAMLAFIHFLHTKKMFHTSMNKYFLRTVYVTSLLMISTENIYIHWWFIDVKKNVKIECVQTFESDLRATLIPTSPILILKHPKYKTNVLVKQYNYGLTVWHTDWLIHKAMWKEN